MLMTNKSLFFRKEQPSNKSKVLVIKALVPLILIMLTIKLDVHSLMIDASASELGKRSSWSDGQDNLEDVVVVAGSSEQNDVIEQQQQAAASSNTQQQQRHIATSQPQPQHQQQLQYPKQPTFGEPDAESNLKRVVVGRSVRLKCVVNDIGNHSVSWFHKDKRVLLAIDNKVINWRDRVQVSSQADSVFFLHFEHVQLSDKVSDGA